MTGFNHTLVGASIGLAIKQPVLIAPIAFISHIICDSLPHFADNKRFRPFGKNFIALLIFDAILCFTILGLSMYFLPSYWWPLIVGMFFATLPDFLWIPYYYFKEPKNFFYKVHINVQWGQRPYGWIYEIGYFGVFLLLFISLGMSLS